MSNTYPFTKSKNSCKVSGSRLEQVRCTPNYQDLNNLSLPTYQNLRKKNFRYFLSSALSASCQVQEAPDNFTEPQYMASTPAFSGSRFWCPQIFRKQSWEYGTSSLSHLLSLLLSSGFYYKTKVGMLGFRHYASLSPGRGDSNSTLANPVFYVSYIPM